MTDYDLIAVSFFMTIVMAIAKLIARANYGKGVSVVRALSLKAKVKCVIVLTQLINECRMYDKRPKGISNQCCLCAARGRWFRCDRSRELRKQYMTNTVISGQTGEQQPHEKQ